MSSKTKDNRNACRLVVVKIVDSGPITQNNHDIDGNDINEGSIIRQSPQQKRPASPISVINGIHNKKMKVEQPINNIKKKPVQSLNNKSTINNKKTKLVSYKSSSVLEEKTSKNLLTKELNQTINMKENSDNSLSKPRTSTKLIKSQSTNDIKSSIPLTITNNKKKESVLSPSKSKSILTSQTILKKPINKNQQKITIKTEPITNSPLNVSIKQESSPQSISTNTSSSNTTTSVSIINLKKIPKKPLPAKTEEKRSRSLMPISKLNQNLSQNSEKQKITTSKTQSSLKRDHSSSSINSMNSNNNNVDRPRKTKIMKDNPISQPSNSSRNDQSKRTSPKPVDSPSQSHIDLPTNSTTDTFQLSVPTPPSTHAFQNEDNHISMNINLQTNDDQLQLSDASNSPHEQMINFPSKIPCSDQSDTNDSNISIEDDNEEQDLPTSLTNDDLRYKLIYIYKRFQLNSINDLIIFVQFFKRHQLIDISSLSMTKTANDMFTYDLFSLSPSHIRELANDLGYTTTNII